LVRNEQAWLLIRFNEIQVYNAEIADVGQWTLEQHLNYAAVGQTQPEFPGASLRTEASKALLNLPME
jgi:hypothetical protein